MKIRLPAFLLFLLLCCFACSADKEDNVQYHYEDVQEQGQMIKPNQMYKDQVSEESILEPEEKEEIEQLTTGEVIKKTFSTMKDLQLKENPGNNPARSVMIGIKAMKMMFAEIDGRSASGGKGLFSILKEIFSETAKDIKQIPAELYEEEELALAESGKTKEIILEPIKSK